MRRIRVYQCPGLGQVRLQSLTAGEGCDVEQSRMVDGKPNFRNYALTLVSKMRLEDEADILFYRDPTDIEDMDWSVFSNLYELCEQHRDFISPEELAKNLPAGEVDSPPASSSAGLDSAASTNCSTGSANGNGSSGRLSVSYAAEPTIQGKPEVWIS